jgi:hypothetical protein
MATYELGRVVRGVAPVLRDGTVVATLAASNWREQAAATVGEQRWRFERRGGELRGRLESDPEGHARLTARQTSWWRGTWSLTLEGTPVDMSTASIWRGTHRYRAGDRPVAESGTTGRWSPRPTLTADDALPVGQVAFLLWLEVVLRRRASAAASAATIGGATAAGSS